MPSKNLDDLRKDINTGLNNIYPKVYMSDPQGNRTLSYMRTRVHRGIDNLISNNVSNSGMSNISRIYGKLNMSDVQNDKDVIQGINSTMKNESLMNDIMVSYTQNSWLRDLDREIDMVCKYMPKLDEALDVRREHVLSADHFSKNSINIRNSSATGKEIGASSNIKEMREKYEADDLMERIYKHADKRGECYTYICNYKKALKQLLANKNGNMNITNESGVIENAPLPEKFVNEAFTINMANEEIITENIKYAIDEGADYIGGPLSTKSGKFVVEINKSGVLESAIADKVRANSIMNEMACLSVNESAKKPSKEDNTNILDTMEKNKASMYNTDGLAQDGVSLANMKSITSYAGEEIKVPGCVVKILDRTMVKPLYIEETCLGYFYIECDRKFDLDQTTFSSTLGGVRAGNGYKPNTHNSAFEDSQENLLLKKISMSISQKVNSQFINMNQDLTKEIYMILKYNATMNAVGRVSKMRITFIPPEDIVHAYFDFNTETHRGISSLARALFPAKLYSCLYISNVINNLTRGNDRRVFYVKQQVDTNISGVLLNTLNQIQRSNFGLRQIESMNNVLNTLGRFNDFLIPRSPSGEAPIDFEVIPGQNVEFKTDLMNMLEECAINSTTVPLEVIAMRQQVDYATHLTMTNTKFLQNIYNRQGKFKRICDKVLTKIYDAEYECTDSIDVMLPPPMYLNLMNTSQIFQSANDMATNATEIYAGDKSAPVQERFQRKIKRFYMQTFLPEDDIMQMLAESEMEAAKAKDEIEQQQ